jgi:hypothetical protein
MEITFSFLWFISTLIFINITFLHEFWSRNYLFPINGLDNFPIFRIISISKQVASTIVSSKFNPDLSKEKNIKFKLKLLNWYNLLYYLFYIY